MKKDNNTNNWNSFSRGLFVALVMFAIFCGICAIGAAFSNIPWLLLSGGICILLSLGAIIWFLGYLSRNVKQVPDYDIDDIEIDDTDYEEGDDDLEYGLTNEPNVQVFKKPNPPVKIVEDKQEEQPEEKPQQKPVPEAKAAAQSQKRAQQQTQSPKKDISRFNMFPEESKTKK